MAHDHSHEHGGYSHDQLARGKKRGGNKGGLAVTFRPDITTFMVAEAIGGLLTGSLTLLADAGHMLSDSASLGLAFFAAWLARLQAGRVLAALAHGVTLVAISSIWIFNEAYQRLQEPPGILGGWMLAVTVLALVVNIVGIFILSRAEQKA
jgi:cobalt-zinc-cadmium efflux system protein